MSSNNLTTRDGLVGNSPRYTGYLSPPYQKFLKDDAGNAINLTNILPSAFTLLMVNQSNPLLVKSGGGTFSIPSPASQGLMSYAYAYEDLADAGNWYLFITVKLSGEQTPRVFDPDFLTIKVYPGGGFIVTVQDINLVNLEGVQISPSNPVPIAGPVTIPDGGSVAQGATTDSSSASTTIGLLKAIKAYLAGTLTTTTTISGNVTEANSSAILTDMNSLVTSAGSVGDAAWSGSGNGSVIAILKKLEAIIAATLTVTGTVTANAGSNLNTSLLALESGGHLASIDTHTPALGQATMANSVPVALASNQSPIQAAGNPTSTATLSNVVASATSVLLLAANTSRKTLYVYNDGTANLFIAYGATASTTAYTVKVPSNGFYEMPVNPVWQGAVSGIWDVANGSARITEVV